MITFLPVKSFVKSMEYLDDARLSSQRSNAAKILEILTQEVVIPSKERPICGFDPKLAVWERHPAVQMWVGHEEWLKLYLACAIGEWVSRGYSNTIRVPTYDTSKQYQPKWLGYEDLHQSHRSNLIRKAPSIYHQYWPEEDNDLVYFWPTLEGFDVSNPSKTRRVV